MSARHVLYIEDDPQHARLLRGAAQELRLPIELHVVDSVIKGLEFLGQRDRYAASPIVSMVVLDLVLPLVSGHEFLQGMQQDAIFRAIPVVVYTRSISEADQYLVGRLKVPYVVKDHTAHGVEAFAKKISAVAHGESRM